MIDIHTHILFNVDDGSDTINESVALIKSAEKAGVTHIILTPHYTGSSLDDYKNENVDENFKELSEEVNKRNINVKLFLGNEVAIYSNVYETLNDVKVKTLANSRYMLIEFPMQSNVGYCLNTIYEMKVRNIIPIIAHPERCECFKKDITLVEKAIEEGALIQVNLGSFFGDYGLKSKRIAKVLLKRNQIHFIATDNHHIINNKYTVLEERLCKLSWRIGEAKLQKLTRENQEKILNNEEIAE